MQEDAAPMDLILNEQGIVPYLSADDPVSPDRVGELCGAVRKKSSPWSAPETRPLRRQPPGLGCWLFSFRCDAQSRLEW